jgi:hypothetical protein
MERFPTMVFAQIEKLKREYTDKYVVVTGNRPELARFAGQTGKIKTVNMGGRALVEFGHDNNIGWFDIALDFLKVVDQPPPKPAEEKAKPAEKKAAPAKPAAAKAPPTVAGEKKLSPLELARQQGAAKKPAGAPAKASTADILAAARAGKPAAEAKPAARAVTPAPGQKLSTADILAAARSKAPPQDEAAAAPGAPPQAPAAEKPVPAPKAVSAPQAEKLAAPPAVAAKPAAAPARAATGELPTTTAEKIAWCRRVDAKS